MIDEKKFNYTKQDIFGKYCKIPMCADGEKHIFKCIGVFQSNTYMDVPIYPIHEMTQHQKEFNSLEDLEWVVNVIHCGIDETKVIRVALKDIEITEDETTEIANSNPITIVVGNQLEFETDLLKQLIKEHFDNPSIKFEELKLYIPFWDKKENEWCYFTTLNSDSTGVKISINELPYIQAFIFEENRFYRKQVEDND